MLFVPGMAPYDQDRGMGGGKSRNIRLYVKRVFISGGCRGVQRGPEQAGWLAGRLGITSTDALQCHPPRHTVPYCAAPPRVLPCARRRV